MPGLETHMNILITIGTAILLFIIFILFRHHTRKKGDDMKRWHYIVGYLLNVFLLLGSIIYILWIWVEDFMGYFDTFFSNAVESLESSLVKLISTVIVLFITILVLKVLKMTVNNVGNKKGIQYRRKKTLAKLALSIIRYLGWIIAIIIILAIWGVNVGPALAGLGILGLVIGLGAQKFINDLISGLFIIFEQHYDVGDIIETNGFKGEVIDIGLKTTRIKNWKGEVKILSNGSISDTVNFSKYPSLAIVDFGIAYAEDIDKTIAVLKKALPRFKKRFPEIIADPEILGVTQLAGSSVDLRVIARTLTNQHFNVERQLRAFIKSTLDKNNIEIPFPQIVVHQPETKPKKPKQLPKRHISESPKPKTLKK